MTVDGRVVAFTPTLDDTLAAQRLAASSALWRYGFGAAACGIGAAAGAGGTLSAPLVAAVALGAAAVYAGLLALVWRVWFPRRVAKHYRQQASLRQDYRVSWDEAGLLSETAQSRNFVRWSDYVKRREDAATILLYQSDLLFQFLPKRALTDAQLASLRPLVDAVPAGRGASHGALRLRAR